MNVLYDVHKPIRLLIYEFLNPKMKVFGFKKSRLLSKYNDLFVWTEHHYRLFVYDEYEIYMFYINKYSETSLVYVKGCRVSRDKGFLDEINSFSKNAQENSIEVLPATSDIVTLFKYVQAYESVYGLLEWLLPEMIVCIKNPGYRSLRFEMDNDISERQYNYLSRTTWQAIDKKEINNIIGKEEYTRIINNK